MADLLDYALTSVADVKESLGIPSGNSQYNNLIIRKINQATEMIERYCGRRFAATDYTEEYDASGTDQLILKQRPINSITSLSQRDTSLNEADWEALDSEFYFHDANAGVIEAVFVFIGKWNRYRVIYNAGYTTIPSDLAEACATLAAFLTENNGSVGIKRKKEGMRELEYHSNQDSSDDSLFAQLGILGILNSYANNPILADK